MECINIIGVRDKSQLKYIRVTCDSSAFYTIAVNDTVCKSLIDDEKGQNCMGEKVIKIDAAARNCCVGNVNANLLIIPTHKKKIIFINDLEISKEITIKYTPISCTLSSDDQILAICSGRDGDNFVYFYIKKSTIYSW